MPLSPIQKEFYKAFQSQKYLYMLFGGAISSGKSIMQIGIIHQMAMDYSNTRYAIIRKNLSTLKRTSIPTYDKVLELNSDTDSVNLNRAESFAEYKNGSKLLFIEADKTKDFNFNKLRGLELTMALIEEANEIEEEAFQVLKTRVGRWNNNEYKIRPIVMLNCNPDKGWIKKTFYEPYSEGRIHPPYYFKPALPTDNPYNSKDYLAAINTLPEKERQRFVLGNWEVADDPNQLIQYLWMKENLVNSDMTFDNYLSIANREIFLGVDVARYGDDRTVFSWFLKNNLLKIESFRKIDTSETAEKIKERIDIYRVPSSHIGIDVGMGSGTIDTLKRNYGINVYSFGFGERPGLKKKPETPQAEDRLNRLLIYKNKRAEAHWMLREALRLGDIKIIDHKELITEATSVCYSSDDKVIQIESKDSVKKRLGFSSDILDSVVIANYMRVKKGRIMFKSDAVVTSKRLTMADERPSYSKTLNSSQKFYSGGSSRLIMSGL